MQGYNYRLILYILSVKKITDYILADCELADKSGVNHVKCYYLWFWLMLKTLCTQCICTLRSPITIFFWSLSYCINFWCCFQLNHSFINTPQTLWNYTRVNYIGLSICLSELIYFFMSIWRCWSCVVFHWSVYKKCNISIYSSCLCALR